ncbi:hypothetical protein Cgig2_016048 [Carnegiea gigantea]|uniref:Uncharacterized protein n=1 Tax=Carnegiea gigantea TaxID=171969 RepID=A0A9Q1QL19_9CARY|nr:hypothetical protein Cgig2_016048 [Carnegiea gigantea]
MAVDNISYWDLREEDDEAACSFAPLYCDAFKFEALKAAVELDIIDMIRTSGCGAHLTPAEIAAKLPTTNLAAPTMLRRLLDYLVSHSIFTVTPTTLPDGSVERRLHLKATVLEGGKPFEKAHGMSLYEYSGKDPEHQKDFHKAMSDHSALVQKKLLKTYKGLEGLSSLVDVGGGNGAALSMILSSTQLSKA